MGINVDPIPGCKKLFDEARPMDINLEFAVSNVSGELVYYIFDEGALNTFSPDMVQQAYANYSVKPIDTKKIKVMTLSDCLDEFMPNGAAIDLMNVDVEELDYEVLTSNNWLRYKPRVIV
jgi:hypothetical protein